MPESGTGWPFPTPPFPVSGIHPADVEPQTSWSSGGLRRLGGMVKAVDRAAAGLAAWWAGNRPLLDSADLDADHRRRLLRDGRTLAWVVSVQIQSLQEVVTHMAACDAMADADEPLATLFDRALRWDFTWAYRQEDAAAATADPLDHPQRFRVELQHRLQAGGAGR